MEKRCSKCGEEKELKNFKKDKRNKNGHTSICLICNRLWYKFNRDKHRHACMKYRKNNREKIEMLVKLWQEQNAEKYRQYTTERSRQNVKNLTDRYIIDILRKLGIKVTSETIQVKREQIKIHRVLESLAEELNERAN